MLRHLAWCSESTLKNCKSIFSPRKTSSEHKQVCLALIKRYSTKLNVSGWQLFSRVNDLPNDYTNTSCRAKDLQCRLWCVVLENKGVLNNLVIYRDWKKKLPAMLISFIKKYLFEVIIWIRLSMIFVSIIALMQDDKHQWANAQYIAQIKSIFVNFSCFSKVLLAVKADLGQLQIGFLPARTNCTFDTFQNDHLLYLAVALITSWYFQWK